MITSTIDGRRSQYKWKPDISLNCNGYAYSLILIFLLCHFSALSQNPLGIKGKAGDFEIDADFISNNFTNPGPTGLDWRSVLNPLGLKVQPGISTVLGENAAWYVDGNSGIGTEGEVFKTGSNKNGDYIAPGQSPYQFVIQSPSAPQKNDLTNIYIRSKRLSGKDWLFLGAETRSTDGTSYLDFEYNQYGLTLNRNTLQITGNASETTGGRTARSDAGPGDVLFVVDFATGGNSPIPKIFEWRRVSMTGNKQYDWYEIEIPVGMVYIVTNGSAIEAAGENTGFTGSGQPTNTTIALQFVEIGVNLTDLGLLIGNPCSPDATIMAKTRTSSSYTSELKDFNLFSFIVNDPGRPTPTPVILCQGDATSPLQAVLGANGVSLKWYQKNPLTGVYSLLASAPTPSSATTGIFNDLYFVSQVNADGCEGMKVAIPITINAKPEATNTSQTLCSSSSNSLQATFDLTSKNSAVTNDADGVSVEGWYETYSSGVFTNKINSPEAYQVTVSSKTVYAKLIGSNNCTNVAQNILTVNPMATANAGIDQIVCASNAAVTLGGSYGGAASSASWVGGTGLFNPGRTTLNAVYTPSASEITAGTVTLNLQTDDPAGPCPAVSDEMIITINPAAEGNAGADQTVCEGQTIPLNGSIGGGASSGSWVGGAGSFNPDRNALNAVYTPTVTEVLAGTVTLTWRTNDPDGPCPAVEDQMVINIVKCSKITVQKLTNGVVNNSKTWTFAIYEDGKSGFNGDSTPVQIRSEATGISNNSLLFNTLPVLSAYKKYTLCELQANAGWSQIWMIDEDGDGVGDEPIAAADIFNPDADNATPEDAGNRCIEIGFGTSYSIPTNLDGTAVANRNALQFVVDNSYPQGDARTPGYWKNWNRCSGGNQQHTADKNGGFASGFWLVENALVVSPISWGSFHITTCEIAVAILDSRSISSGKKMSSDAAYTLGRALLAAQLNFRANAQTCAAATNAASEAVTLLASIGFNGTSTYLTSKVGDRAKYARALELAGILDRYNNNILCSLTPAANIPTEAPVTLNRSGIERSLLAVNAYPNPFTNRIKFELHAEESGQGSLEIFNMLGQKINTAFQGQVEAGRSLFIDYKVSDLHRGNLIYIFKLGKHQVTGKLVGIRQ